MKKPLAALLLSAATVAALVAPAGAATPKRTTWEHQSFPCSTGHKSATWVEKWQGDSVTKGWYNNPCKGQWLELIWCAADSQSDCHALDVPAKRHGQLGVGQAGAYLNDGPSCTDGTTVVDQLGAKTNPQPPCPGA